MVLLAAIPSASERITTTKNPEFFSRLRVAKRTSAHTVSNAARILMFALPPRPDQPFAEGTTRSPRNRRHYLRYQTNPRQNSSLLAPTRRARRGTGLPCPLCATARFLPMPTLSYRRRPAAPHRERLWRRHHTRTG